MSRKDVQVVKKIKTKTDNGSYSEESYIGTDARFVDMPSGNNLSEELLLGKSSSTIIGTDENDNPLITEEYKIGENYPFYSKSTLIIEGEETNIIEKLYININNGLKELVKQKITTIKDGEITEIKEVIN